MANQQLTMFMSDYEKLEGAMDCAAYRCVGAIASALGYARVDRSELAFQILTDALENYERAENKLTAYKKQGAHNGNRPAAA